jgi:hypothetical protein
MTHPPEDLSRLTIRTPPPAPVSSTGQALFLPMKGRETVMFLPLQGEGQEGDRVWCR